MPDGEAVAMQPPSGSAKTAVDALDSHDELVIRITHNGTGMWRADHAALVLEAFAAVLPDLPAPVIGSNAIELRIPPDQYAAYLDQQAIGQVQ